MEYRGKILQGIAHSRDWHRVKTKPKRQRQKTRHTDTLTHTHTQTNTDIRICWPIQHVKISAENYEA